MIAGSWRRQHVNTSFECDFQLAICIAIPNVNNLTSNWLNFRTFAVAGANTARKSNQNIFQCFVCVNIYFSSIKYDFIYTIFRACVYTILDACLRLHRTYLCGYENKHRMEWARRTVVQSMDIWCVACCVGKNLIFSLHITPMFMSMWSWGEFTHHAASRYHNGVSRTISNIYYEIDAKSNCNSHHSVVVQTAI